MPTPSQSMVESTCSESNKETPITELVHQDEPEHAVAESVSLSQGPVSQAVQAMNGVSENGVSESSSISTNSMPSVDQPEASAPESALEEMTASSKPGEDEASNVHSEALSLDLNQAEPLQPHANNDPLTQEEASDGRVDMVAALVLSALFVITCLYWVSQQ